MGGNKINLQVMYLEMIHYTSCIENEMSMWNYFLYSTWVIQWCIIHTEDSIYHFNVYAL